MIINLTQNILLLVYAGYIIYLMTKSNRTLSLPKLQLKSLYDSKWVVNNMCKSNESSIIIFDIWLISVMMF